MDELLRSRRPAPPQRLVDDLVARVEGTQPTRGRGRSRLRYTLAVAVSVALLIPVASFGGLSSISSGVIHAASVTVHEIVKATKKPGKPKKKKKGKAGVGRVFASIGTYAAGSWICHWQGGTYDATTAAQGTNWLPVQLTNPAIYTAHQFETFDIGPSPSLTTQGACVAAATGGNALTATATATTTSPTNAATIVFSVSFSQSVSDFAVGDITVGGTAGGTLVAAIGSGSGAGPYVINVTGQTSSGTVTINIGSGTVHRASGVANFASGTPSVTYDNVAPTVTINQAGGQADPTNATPINFTVTFSESVTGFDATDVTLGGTAGATTVVVTGSGSTYNVAVGGMTATGTVTATIAANRAQDAATNQNTASTSGDNSVQFNSTITITSPTEGQTGFSRTGPFTGTGAPASSTVTVVFCQATTFTTACEASPTASGTTTSNGSGAWSLTIPALQNNKDFSMRATSGANSSVVRHFHT